MKNNARRGFIYFRYILPIAIALIMMGLMFVPCYRFITADTGINKPISAYELISNSWDTVRDYLFGGTEQVEVTKNFASTVFGLIILFVILFCVGFISAVYAAVVAFKFFAGGCRETKERLLFITLVPNRAVLCLYYALMLPLLAFPRLMPALYDGILNYHVELICQPFDIFIVDGILFAAAVAVIFVSARFETLAKSNLFVRYKSEEKDEEYSPVYEEPESTDDPYENMLAKAKQEQNERILKLLRKDDGADGDGEQEK